MKKVEYIKCPRCEVNYIKSTDKICDVCQAELSRKLGGDDEDDDEMILCPVCNKNFIGIEEEMCEQCLAEREEEDGDIILEADKDESWRTFLDDDKDVSLDDDTSIEISLSELEEDEIRDEIDGGMQDDLVDVFDNLNQ